MEYSDEWWKGKDFTSPACTDNDPAFHGTCGTPAGYSPDDYDYAEWWGIMRNSKNALAALLILVTFFLRLIMAYLSPLPRKGTQGIYPVDRLVSTCAKSDGVQNYEMIRAFDI
jgi:hypothetical protein